MFTFIRVSPPDSVTRAVPSPTLLPPPPIVTPLLLTVINAGVSDGTNNSITYWQRGAASHDVAAESRYTETGDHH